MTHDAIDKIAGTMFLDSVSDDLDCLVYHLSHENPSLCDRNSSASKGVQQDCPAFSDDLVVDEFDKWWDVIF